MTDGPDVPLLGAAEIRALAAQHGIRPTKQWGQNFVVDGNTVRRIVRVAGVGRGRHRRRGRPRPGVADPGPAARSVDRVVAVEVDPVLAGALPDTVAAHAPALADRLEVVQADALAVRSLPGPPPTALVANLPYNVSVPVVLRFLELFPEPAHHPGHGAARGGRAPRRTARVAHLRRAERQGRLVRRRAAGRVGVAQRLLAGAQRRLRAGHARPAASRRSRPPPARRSSPASTRRSPSAARPCGRRWPAGPARRPWPRRRWCAAGVDPRTRGEQLDVAAFAAIAAARSTARAERA